jgi:hypothetical protein
MIRAGSLEYAGCIDHNFAPEIRFDTSNRLARVGIAVHVACWHKAVSPCNFEFSSAAGATTAADPAYCFELIQQA